MLKFHHVRVYFSSKWKPSITTQGASSLYHLIRMESFSVYLNPSCGAYGLVTDLVDAGSTPYCWRNEMKKGLETFSINKEDFNFSKCSCHNFTVPLCTSCFIQCLGFMTCWELAVIFPNAISISLPCLISKDL
jgi:hypothetical protein